MGKSRKTPKRRNNGAVSQAWAIFGKRPKAARWQQLAAAVAAGINPHTAATQYQIWSHATAKERAARGARFTWQKDDLKPVADKKAKPEVRHG